MWRVAILLAVAALAVAAPAGARADTFLPPSPDDWRDRALETQPYDALLPGARAVVEREAGVWRRAVALRDFVRRNIPLALPFDCGHFAILYARLAQAIGGIPVRVVAGSLNRPRQLYDAHTTDEVYLAELGRWVMVDAMFSGSPRIGREPVGVFDLWPRRDRVRWQPGTGPLTRPAAWGYIDPRLYFRDVGVYLWGGPGTSPDFVWQRPDLATAYPGAEVSRGFPLSPWEQARPRPTTALADHRPPPPLVGGVPWYAGARLWTRTSRGTLRYRPPRRHSVLLVARGGRRSPVLRAAGGAPCFACATHRAHRFGRSWLFPVVEASSVRITARPGVRLTLYRGPVWGERRPARALAARSAGPDWSF